ncbi:MAG: DNA-deoxyinosine glycosylase [Bacillota bacterium]
MMINNGFEPIFNENSKILILGSFPGVVSRNADFYYGNPRNRFWIVLAEIFSEEPPQTKEEKTNFILSHNLALWDVLETCAINGSADSDINLSNSTPIDLGKITNRAQIHQIICNGKKSYELFKKHFPTCEIKTTSLPSTSPANARCDKSKWIECFSDIANPCAKLTRKS